MDDYKKILSDVARIVEKKTGIPAYERTVLNVLNAISITKDVFWISRYAREAFNLVVAILKELEKEKIIAFQDGVRLTDKGKKILDTIGYEARIEVCDMCKGRRVLLDILPGDVVKEFIKIQKERPPPIQQYDQGYVTPETTLARVAYMYHKGDLKGREIIFLGDDDLVSIAVGLTHMARRIAVIDIDERLTDFIAKKSKEYGLNIEILTTDRRKPLPEELSQKFDVFQTDPLETVAGFRVFVGRGIATLKGPRCAGYFYLTLVDSSLDKSRDIQHILLEEFKVVINMNGQAFLADYLSSDCIRTIGINIVSTQLGQTSKIQTSGKIIIPSANFTEPIVYLGAQGAILQQAPTTGCVIILGRVLSSNSFLIDIEMLYKN